MSEFLTWSALATFTGTVSAVVIITQFTKGLKLIQKIPTQCWSFIIALVILYPAFYFTGRLTLETAAIIPLNAVVVSLSANGGFEGLHRMMPGVFKKNSEDKKNE